MFTLMDVSFDQLDEQFKKLSDEILGKVKKLGPKTGIGSNYKFGDSAVKWEDLKDVAFKLI